ncbi:RepB family protein [Ferrovum sp.]|jgi:hypothetical protein|nr:RepB family protein [Ferrovum sp.]
MLTIISQPFMLSTMTSSLVSDKEKRKAQLRDAQRRRREKLAQGNRHQINIFLSEASITLLDQACKKYGMDRHELIEQLIHDTAEKQNQ